MTALEAAPKPIDRTAVLRIAGETLPGRELAQFKVWFEKNADYLLTRLNGA